MKTYLADISIGCFDPRQNVSKISFQDQAVYQVNIYHFMSTGANENPKAPLVSSLQIHNNLCVHVHDLLLAISSNSSASVV